MYLGVLRLIPQKAAKIKRKGDVAMKASFKRFVSLLLALVMVFVLTISAFAAGLPAEESFDCKITVILSDWTGEYPDDTLMVHFKDTTGTVDQTVELTIGEMSEFILPGPATYNFVFEGIEEGYKVIDFYTYDLAVTSFTATGILKDFNWYIEKEESGQTEETTVPSVDVSSIIARENVTIVNEEAEKVYLEFLEAVTFMAGDESYYDGFGSTFAQCEKGSLNGDLYCQWYVEYVQGGTEEEFFSMTAFERWLWTNTYTRLAYASGSGNYNMYYGSRASFNTFIVKAAMNLVKGNNSDVIVSAYEKLMDWQWDYISEHGVPFNFIRNRNYIEEINAGSDDIAEPQEQLDEKTEEPSKESQVNVLQEKPSSKNETTVPTTANDKETKSVTITIPADSFVTIIVLAILAVAVLVVIYIHNSKQKSE